MGIVEFSWLFAQNLDVRHGTREGARLAVVNFPEGPPPNSAARSDANRDALIAEICDRMQTPTGASITLTSTGAVDDSVVAKVEVTGQTLTGFLDFVIGSITLNSQVESRMEQAATWTNTAVAGQLCP